MFSITFKESEETRQIQKKKDTKVPFYKFISQNLLFLMQGIK